MHSRRPLPALALVMPHPQLPSRVSLSHLPAPSPHTPRACTPSTPILFPKQLVASPRTSSDSWGSSNGNGEDNVFWEWKPEQMTLLVRVSLAFFILSVANSLILAYRLLTLYLGISTRLSMVRFRHRIFWTRLPAVWLKHRVPSSGLIPSVQRAQNSLKSPAPATRTAIKRT